MQLKRRYIELLCVCLISVICSRANNDTLTLVRRADSLFLLNQFYEAGNYYQKAYYYSNSSVNKINLVLKKIDCLKQQGDFSRAEEIISKVKVDALNDTLLCNLFVQGALCSYLASDYAKAESYFVKLDYKLENKNLMFKNLPLYALVLNELMRWDEARSKVLEYINGNVNFSDTYKQSYTITVDSIYSKKFRPHLKKVEKARLLSQFVPGLGQMYSGYALEGVSSLLLNVMALGATAVGIYFQYYVTGLVIGNYFFGKFYMGNISRAEFLCAKRNYLKLNNYNQSLKTIILRN